MHRPTDAAADGHDAQLIGTAPAELVERRVRNAGFVAAAMAVANVFGYLLNLVASRSLGPTAFGALGALLGLVLIGNVVALGLQTVTARVLADDPAAGSSDAGPLYRLAGVCALGLGVLAALAAPVLVRVLHLDDPWPVWLLPLVLVSLTVTGGQLGLLQGREHFRALSVLYVLASAGKVGGGLVGVAVGGTVTATMLGTAVGSALSVAAGHLLVRSIVSPAGGRRVDRTHARELAWAAYALLGFFSLTNVDVLLARYYLTGKEAGLYAIGAVVAKGAFWLPGFVAVVALPALSDRTRRRRAAVLSISAVTASGVAVTAACAVLGGTVVALVGGDAYRELSGEVWLFAAAGSLFALAQLLLYSRLATTDRRAVAAVWSALGLLVVPVVAGRNGSVTDIVVAVLTAAVVLVAVGAVAEVREHHPALRGRGEPAGQDPSAGQAGGA
jgi:O-antigen/teichoic acid export membrane protein